MNKVFSMMATLTPLLLTASFTHALFSAPVQAATLSVFPWSFLRTPQANSAPKEQNVERANFLSLENKMKALANHDLVILLDRSGSMETADCPVGSGMGSAAVSVSKSEQQSRWQWCCEQTRSLTGQTGKILKNGLRLVVFSSLQKVYDNVKLDRVRDIFRANPPTGSTHIAVAIKRQLDDYFRRRSHPENTNEPQRPLIIAVISDGCFDNYMPIQRVISDATKRMNSSDEIAITFLQVGQDQQANRILTNLAQGNNCIARKTAFNIVSAKPFSELQKVGLTNALLDLACADSVSK